MEKLAPTMVPNVNHKDIPGNPSTATSSHLKLNDRADGKPLKVLSEADWAFWLKNGYVIVKNAVPKQQAEATARFLWEFEEKDPQNPETWYSEARATMQMKELAGTGMVEVYNHQQLWNNRQMPRVHDAFTDIWGTEKLWVTIDRANLNFPIRPGFEYKGFIHWDYDPERALKTCRGCWLWPTRPTKTWVGFSVFLNCTEFMTHGNSPNPPTETAFSLIRRRLRGSTTASSWKRATC